MPWANLLGVVLFWGGGALMARALGIQGPKPASEPDSGPPHPLRNFRMIPAVSRGLSSNR
jgi:hypothetical protein